MSTLIALFAVLVLAALVALAFILQHDTYQDLLFLLVVLAGMAFVAWWLFL